MVGSVMPCSIVFQYLRNIVFFMVAIARYEKDLWYIWYCR